MKYQEDYRLRENARKMLGEMARIAFVRLTLDIAPPGEQPAVQSVLPAPQAGQE